MPGEIKEITEAEYHASPELNSTLLADFADSPDEALKPREEKQCFDIGHQFEDYIFQEVTGDPWFDEKYTVAGLGISEPETSFKLANSGIDLEKHIAENKAKYFTKKSDYTDLNSTNANTYAWLQVRIKAGERRLISQYNMDMIEKMADNFLKMEIDLYQDGSCYPVRELLPHAEFQKKVFWDGKRAMFDVLLIWDGTAFVIDIKTAVKGQFYSMFKNKYGPIQNPHYIEGAESLIGQYEIKRVFPKVYFLGATKATETKPLEYSTCLAFSHSVEDEAVLWVNEEYRQTVEEFREWDEAGRKPVGYREHRELSLYPQFNR